MEPLILFSTVVQIFVEHWGDNLQFYPNFFLFFMLGGMNLDHDFFQVSKLSKDQTMEHFFSPNSGEDQKRKGHHRKWNAFFPRIQVRIKKKVFSKNGKLFSQIQVKIKKKGLHPKMERFFSLMHTRVKLLGGGCR